MTSTETAGSALLLAAAPTFAAMALYTSASPDILCSTMPAPMNGMVTMYMLMSLFHASPWLKLITGWWRDMVDRNLKDADRPHVRSPSA
ncbi:MAG TPA: hypothetical protein VGU69_02660 [Rhizomicrobium sp.]|nr:hypothetical protein [Rhizomicrobium sp.]